ncbi:MAG: hypothetical protein ACI9OJ_003101 [Myxococcota bacterium]|jgi:hypothetical protein
MNTCSYGLCRNFTKGQASTCRALSAHPNTTDPTLSHLKGRADRAGCIVEPGQGERDAQEIVVAVEVLLFAGCAEPEPNLGNTGYAAPRESAGVDDHLEPDMQSVERPVRSEPEPADTPTDTVVWNSESQLQTVAFSADGRVLAFLSDYSGLEGTLHLLDLESWEVRAVDDHVIWAVGSHAIGLSDDGRRVVYRRTHERKTVPGWSYESALWTWGWDDGAPVQLAKKGVRSAYRLTPDATQVVYAIPDKSV